MAYETGDRRPAGAGARSASSAEYNGEMPSEDGRHHRRPHHLQRGRSRRIWASSTAAIRRTTVQARDQRSGRLRAAWARSSTRAITPHGPTEDLRGARPHQGAWAICTPRAARMTVGVIGHPAFPQEKKRDHRRGGGGRSPNDHRPVPPRHASPKKSRYNDVVEHLDATTTDERHQGAEAIDWIRSTPST